MCGLAGFYLTRADDLDAREVSRALLDQIVTRGRDATGASWAVRKSDGIDFRVAKNALPAPAFTGWKGMQPTTRAAILHTRWATKGSPANPLNNHPIVNGPITGVHNGVLTNDDALFRRTKATRHAQVDSEAAFALLGATKGHPTTALPLLRGRAALAWFDRRDRSLTLHLARASESPLALAQTKPGGLIFASTMSLLEGALETLGVEPSFTLDVDEGTYLRVRQGRIADFLAFDVPKAKPYRPLRPAPDQREHRVNLADDDEYIGWWAQSESERMAAGF